MISMSQNCKKKFGAIAVIQNLQLVKVLNLANLIWYIMTGKSALSVTKSALAKKLRSQSFSNFLRMLFMVLAFI